MDAAHSLARRQKTIAAVLCVGALVPFCMSIAARNREPRPRPAGGSIERPALAFHQYLINLRDVPPSPVVGAGFAFTNRGESPVVITGLKSSCGCLKPRLEKRTYAPGESGRFMLRVETPGEKPGEKEYHVRVLFEDPAPREAVLTLKLRLPEVLVSVDPKALMVYQYGEGETTRELLVTDIRPGGLNITEAACDSPHVRLERLGEELLADGGRQHRLLVTITGDAPPGRHQAMIVIATDDPEYRRLHVPVVIERRDAGEISIPDRGKR